MPIPSKQDIAKKKADLEKHLKQLNEQGRLNEKKLVSMLRDAIRQVWMRAPNKLAKIEQARIADTDPATRTKWLFKCEMCEQLFKQSDIEVDHKEGNHSFITLEGFETYCDKILNASIHDLQILCIEDHACKTYMERYNVPWEEATKIKKAIRLENEVCGKGKGKAKKAKEYLLSKGFKANEVNNNDNRRLCFIKLVEGSDV